jgi:two-component system OmpR family sensor kinase
MLDPKDMRYNNAFWLTRWRLAGLYAGTMGLILAVFGVGFYVAMARDHRLELDHRLESVAATLHDGIEPSLQQPGQLSPLVFQLVPGLCEPSTMTCPEKVPGRHLLSIVHQDGFYVRFLDLSGTILALSDDAPRRVISPIESGLQTLEKADGQVYRQISLRLKNAEGKPWGYLQVGRSLQDLHYHLLWVRVALLAGFPVVMGLIGSVSWWIAGVAIRPAYHSYRQVQQFTADAAHELRTPLAAVQATVDDTLNEREIADDRARDTLQRVARQNQRLSQLVQDLLLLSRMDLQMLPSQLTQCCLNELVDDLVEEFSSLAIAADLTLSPDIRINHSLQVWGDLGQLYRLVGNLITNAIQYTPQGGKITLILRQEKEWAVIQVRDTGVGIAEAEHTHIFDRFYRISRDRARHTGGAGLGLSIARAIAQSHHGTIQVQSESGKGSAFTIRLPLHAG